MTGRFRPRVLIIDDRSDVRSLLSDILALIDCDVEEAADGPEALARFGDGGYDLTVTDLAMPGMDGWEVADALRRRDPGVAVIMFSGSATHWDADRARAEGVTLLQKPIAIADFATAVERALEPRHKLSA